MSSNGPTATPLFNNNKSLYGSRTQSNQSSKKISIIEDKKTLEPVRHNGNSSQGYSSALNSNSYRSSSFSTSSSFEPSISQIHKQVQIQKQALDSYDLRQLHENIYQQLNQWKESTYSRVCLMKERMSGENENVFNELTNFHQSMKTLLEETLIKQLLMMKENPHLVNNDELDRIEEQLNYLEKEIESSKLWNIQLDCSTVEILGDLQLNKLTDSSRYQPLPQAPPSPPPSMSTSPTTNGFHDFHRYPSSLIDEHQMDPTHVLSTFDSNETSQPTPPVWTDTTRQGLNQLSRHVPFRLLISNSIEKRLVENFDISHFSDVVALSCQSANESILTIIHQNNLDEAFEMLTDIIKAFVLPSNLYEIRLLFQKKFFSIISGKRTERLDRMKLKYKLDAAQIFAHVCPQSDERILLLRSDQTEYIIYCLQEIFQNILEQSHFTDDETENAYVLYDPSINYDPSLINDYGGFLINDLLNSTFQTDRTGSTDDLTENHRRSTNSIHSSASSLSKTRYNIDENELNFDESDHNSDDDNDSKRSRSSDDKRIHTKELNYVKGRQVGLLIGPFGQHIAQIREQTGAKIHLTNDDNEPSVIKGTRSQIKEALRLIKECLKTQKPIPRTAYKGGRRR